MKVGNSRGRYTRDGASMERQNKKLYTRTVVLKKKCTDLIFPKARACGLRDHRAQFGSRAESQSHRHPGRAAAS